MKESRGEIFSISVCLLCAFGSTVYSQFDSAEEIVSVPHLWEFRTAEWRGGKIHEL